MACQHITLSSGGHAIVCGTRPKRQRCACGRPADLLCDWKLSAEQLRAGKSATCDSPICGRCTFVPATGKDLCPEHAQAFKAWSADREVRS